MDQIYKGRFIYSLEDCCCRYCLHFKHKRCRLSVCCCLAERIEAMKHFPPFGFEYREEGCDAVDKRRSACRSA